MFIRNKILCILFISIFAAFLGQAATKVQEEADQMKEIISTIEKSSDLISIGDLMELSSLSHDFKISSSEYTPDEVLPLIADLVEQIDQARTAIRHQQQNVKDLIDNLNNHIYEISIGDLYELSMTQTHIFEIYDTLNEVTSELVKTLLDIKRTPMY